MTEPTPTPAPIPTPWPPDWARTIAFLVGILLIIWETVIDQAAHPIAYGPAFLLTGYPLARGVEGILDRLPGGGK